MKVGDKLYSLDYWTDGSRSWTTYTIKKINRTTVSMKGYVWKISINDIGIDFFTSKKECIENAIELHEERLKQLREEEIEPLQHELQYLKKKLGVKK